MRASCLCGEVVWEASSPSAVSHCHCSMCRKSHGSSFATYALVPAASFRVVKGAEHVRPFQSSAEVRRAFCGRCGSVVPAQPAEAAGEHGIVPLGPVEGDPGVRPQLHIFWGSRAPWLALEDGLPRFDAFPPGMDAPVLPSRQLPPAPAGRVRGSCLCGEVAYEMETAQLRMRHCHCLRCRRARSAAHATNVFGPRAAVQFVHGESQLRSYKLPEARYFTQVFCETCGSPMPRLDPERDLAVAPSGSLDDDPGVRAECHIFVADKAPWFEIRDDVPRHDQGAPL